jgi:uncharacterized phage protein (TIGR02220 family)
MKRDPCADCAVVIVAMNAARVRHGLNGPGFRHDAYAVLRNLHARHQEYDVASCLLVVQHKEGWLEDAKMAEYFRPSTLFRPLHFDEYLNAAPLKQRARPETDEYGRCRICTSTQHGASQCPDRTP